MLNRERSRIFADVPNRTSKKAGSKSTPTKNQHAVILGRKGGRKGGLARAKKLTPAQRSESARKAVQVRWAKYRAAKKKAEKEASSEDLN